MAHCRKVNRFTSILTNLTGRPASAWGTSLTPGNNSFPAYTEILSDIAHECFAIEIFINSQDNNSIARNLLVTIGIDHSGGTTYTDCEINYLLGTGATSYLLGGGISYYFPLYVPAGSAIAAKASVNNATVGTCRVGVKLSGRPTDPELVRAGAYVDTFGAVTASSQGTSITSGEASDGAWTEMTSGITTKPYWFFQLGMGCSDTTMTDLGYRSDLSIGDASNKEIFATDLIFNSSGRESLTNYLQPIHNYICDIPLGQRIYTRMQCTGTPDSNLSNIVYALGG